MLDYARDVSVSALAGLLVAAITTAAAMEDVPPERAERHRLAAALGDHAELAMEVAGGHGDAAGEVNVRHGPDADVTAGRDRQPDGMDLGAGQGQVLPDITPSAGASALAG